MENSLLAYVDINLIIMVAVVYGMGMFLKSMPKINNKYIPIMLLFTSIVLTIAYMGFIQELGINCTVIVKGIIQGILIASVAVFGNQTIKQLGKNK